MLSKGLLLLFIVGTYARTVPRFALNQDRSVDGSPSVSIVFPDGYADTLVLSRYYSNQADRLARTEKCHFIGHLEGEPTACVGLTGCPGTEDVEITIMSEHSPETMFKWRKNGVVHIIESAFKDGKARSEILKRDEGLWHVEGGDEEVNSHVEAAEIQIAQNCAGGNCDSIPATNLLTFKFGYDEGFLSKTGSHDNAKAYIQSTMPHIQTFYCHESTLGTKIQLEIDGEIKFYAGKSLQATGAKLQEMFDPTKADLGNADLMVYMGYDTSYWGTIGIAWGKVVCMSSGYNKYKSSINEWRNTHAEAGQLVAHEVGHNVGMDHDFDSHHAAAGCDGTGIMSYGSPPAQWSTCSKSDLQAHYVYTKNNWCMPAAPTACGGGDTTTDLPSTEATTTTTTTAAPEPATCTSPLKCYIGDSFCDAENNNEACQWDGGDCCPPHAHSWWDYFCSFNNECNCLRP